MHDYTPLWLALLLVFAPYCVGTAVGYAIRGMRSKQAEREAERWKLAYAQAIADNIALCSRITGQLERANVRDLHS